MSPGEGGATGVLALIDEVQAIARTGLAYTRDPFDRERYQRLLELAAGFYASLLEVPEPEIRERWAREVGQITPKVGAEAVVVDAAGRVLMLQRRDDGCWGLPGGWLEPNETPAECAVRETREETGLEVRAVRLVDVFTRSADPEGDLHAAVALVYLCEPVGGALRTSSESLRVAYRHPDEVTAWHGWHEEHARAALRLHSQP